MDWEAYAPLVLLLILAGGAAFAFGVAIWSLSWPSVKGRVVVSILDKDSQWTSANGSYFKSESETHQLAYEYDVAGVKFLGANIKPWGDSAWALHTGGGDEPASGKILWSGARDTSRWYRPD